MKINIFNQSDLSAKSLPENALVRRTITRALGSLSKLKGTVNVIFVTEPEIRRLNKQYLRTGALTDVISFNYELPEGDSYEPGFGFGDIFICADAALLQAKHLGHSVKKELLFLAAHGALHLSGMDDATKEQLAAMDARALGIITALAPKLK